MKWRLIWPSGSHEQKEHTPSGPQAKIRSLTVQAIVDLPMPASPFSQKTRDLSKSSVHNLISFGQSHVYPRDHLSDCCANVHLHGHGSSSFETDRSSVFKERGGGTGSVSCRV